MIASDTATITTPRLTLRPPRAEDADDLFAVYADDEVARYLLHGAWQTIGQAQDWIAAAERAWQAATAYHFVVIDTAQARVIGTCQLFSLHTESARAEIGYTLARRDWGRGAMTEALHGLIDWAFGPAGLRRLEAEIDPANRASATLLARLGFVHEGRLRERWRCDGVLSDSDIYGLLARAWPPRPG